MRKRDEARRWSEANLRREVEALAPTVALQLTDQRLGAILEQLNALTAWLTALPDARQRENLLRQAAASAVFSREQIQTASRTFSISAGRDIIDSVIINAERVENVTIKKGGSERNLRHAIQPYKDELLRRLKPLAVGSLVAGHGGDLALAEVYTPVYTPMRRATVEQPPGGDDKSQAEARQIRPEPLGILGALRLTLDRQRSNTGENKDTEASEEALALPERLSLIQALNNTPRAVILGGAGTGKSTVLNYLALGLCGKVHDEAFAQEWTHRAMLPITITLRRFARYLREQRAKPGPEGEKARQDPATVLMRYIREHEYEGMAHVAPDLADHLNEVLQQHGAVWLLDGLDEVNAILRPFVHEAITTLVGRYPRCRFVLTCRTYSYALEYQKLALSATQPPAFAELLVLPFDDEQIGIFVGRWYEEVRHKRNKPNYQARAEKLAQAITQKRYLRRLADNPLLLYLMADLHSTTNADLPEDRWKLLADSLDMLLFRWQRSKYDQFKDRDEDVQQEERIRAALERNSHDQVIEKLSRLALEVHREGALANADSTADIPEAKLMAAVRGLIEGFNLDDDDLKDYLRDRASLLIDDGEIGHDTHVYRFPHRIFQEYLAAIAIRNSYRKIVPLLDADFARWREVYALNALMQSNELGTALCVNQICPLEIVPQTAAAWQRVLLAGEIWLDKKVSAETQAEIDEVRESIDHVRAMLTQALAQTEMLPAPQRAEAGRWQRIPVGPFSMGNDDEVDDLSYDDERPRHTQHIQHDYAISRFPITNAQFDEFVKDNGYVRAEFWGAAIAPGCWESGKVRDYTDTLRECPENYGEPFNLPNHPVVGITWYEAVAFCEWMTEKLKINAKRAELKKGIAARVGVDPTREWTVALPSEAEWERAARGSDAWRYPWGQEPNPNRANYYETGIGSTSAVGCFPNGQNPLTGCEDGCEEMSGNVWEWTRSLWVKNYEGYDHAEDNRIDGSEERRVVRGGAWSHDDSNVRAAIRNWNSPSDRDFNRGLRVVLFRPCLTISARACIDPSGGAERFQA